MTTENRSNSPKSVARFRNREVMDLIRARSSWRSFSGEKINPPIREEFLARIASIPEGPFGNGSRFHLIEATSEDPETLKGLGTYGFIRGMPAFLVGVVNAKSDFHLEDFGYRMELALLHATDLGLASCWLGGSFQRARFAEAVSLSGDDVIPAISPLGYQAKKRRAMDHMVRTIAGSKKRKEFHELFSGFDKLARERWAAPLEAVRLAPSASNKQPWRIVYSPENQRLDFFMVRSPGYREKGEKMKSCDLQRVDMGIAMAHFELVALSENLPGEWCKEPMGDQGEIEGEFLVSWKFG